MFWILCLIYMQPAPLPHFWAKTWKVVTWPQLDLHIVLFESHYLPSSLASLVTSCKITRHRKKLPCTHSFLRVCWPDWRCTEEAPPASEERCRRWTGLLLDICTCLYVSVYMWSQKVRRLRVDASPSFACWQGPVSCWQISRSQLAWWPIRYHNEGKSVLLHS